MEVNIAGVTQDLGNSTLSVDAKGTPLVVTAVVGDDGIVVITVETILSIEEQIEVSVYPNPVGGYLTIKAEGETVIKVLDLSGMVIIEKSFTNDLILDVNDLQQGIHLIEIKNRNGRAIRKLIKK